MRNYRVLQFMFFMDDLLEIITNSCLNFHQNGSTSIDFLDAIQMAFLELIQLRQKPSKTLQEVLDTIVKNNDKPYYKDTELEFFHEFDNTNFQSIIDIVFFTKSMEDLKTPITLSRQFCGQPRYLTQMTGQQTDIS